ncbi:MAG: hypothetical protein ACRCW0_06025 [Clostridium sp.]
MISDASVEMRDVVLKQKKLENINEFFVTSLFMISIGIILTMASISVVKGNMTIGALTAILMYNHMLIDPLIEILDIQQKIVKLVVSMRKINDVFVLPNDININKPIVKIDKVQF